VHTFASTVVGFDSTNSRSFVENPTEVDGIHLGIPLYTFILVFDEWMRGIREFINSGDEYLCSDQSTSLDHLPTENRTARDTVSRLDDLT
jgi:hypothetical protein